MQTTYGVHKTENLKDYFLLNNEIIQELNLLELGIALISVINGKHKVLPILYGVRETLENSLGALHEPFDNVVNDPNLKVEKESFINLISNHLVNKYGYAFDVSRMHVLKALNSYLKNFLPHHRGTIVRKLKMVTKKISLVIKKVIPGILFTKIQTSFYKTRLKRLSQKFGIPTYKLFEDLNKIQKYILSHPI